MVWPTGLGGELTWGEGLALAGWSEGSRLLMVICLSAWQYDRAHLLLWATRSRTSALLLGFLDDDDDDGDDDDEDDEDDEGGASWPCSLTSSACRVDRHSAKVRVSRRPMPSSLAKSASFISISRSGVIPWCVVTAWEWSSFANTLVGWWRHLFGE